MLSRFLRVLSVIFLTLSLLSFVAAQTGRGVITGRVVDSAGAVLPGAKVGLQPSALPL